MIERERERERERLGIIDELGKMDDQKGLKNRAVPLISRNTILGSRNVSGRQTGADWCRLVVDCFGALAGRPWSHNLPLSPSELEGPPKTRRIELLADHSPPTQVNSAPPQQTPHHNTHIRSYGPFHEPHHRLEFMTTPI